jgi:hypothetical protein
MVHHIHKDFLKSPEQYRQAEDYWRELWQRLVTAAGVAGQWRQPWLAAPLPTGDPIFSAISRGQQRAVHVIQHEPTCDRVECVWWIDEFGEEAIDEVICQLVVSCALSTEAAAQAYELLRSWITRGKVEPPAESPNGPAGPPAETSRLAR